MNYKKMSTTMFLSCLYVLLAAQSINIIPQPQKVEMKKGFFVLNEKTSIYFNDQQLKSLANYTSATIKSFNKLQLHVKSRNGTKSNAKSINLILDPKINTAKEGYALSVSSKEISIKANTSHGLFLGVQSLFQLIPINGDRKVPSLLIEDEPRFAWRGLLLDVSRHFFTIDEVKHLIDQMATYKFNLLQLHLTDDQGWRLEIKSYPELTKIGAWRVPRTGLWWERECPQEGEEATYGGFYTQEEIKDLIKYAAKYYINILPEIDVPGHSLSAIAAYPYLSSSGLKYNVNPGCQFYGIDDNSLCAGKESTYEFLNIVFTEVAELFPFEYIHIGGDECYKGFWKKCEDCQKRMKDNGLKDVNELQSYFIKRLEKMLKEKGKKLMGWDEILEGGLAPNASVMSWRGMKGGIAAAKANHHVVMSPNGFAYLDLYQGDPAIEPPAYSMLRLNTVYAFEPVPVGVDSSFILGGQGNLWTESVPTFRQAEYMLWPRSFALAEVLWSPKQSRNWTDFIRRTEEHLQRLSKADINYARSFYDAIIIPSKDEKGNLLIQLSTEIEGLEIYYTFDNTYPDHYSPLYKKEEKLAIPKDADTFRVITYRDGKQIGRIITILIADLAKRVK
ncbi:MAG: family 20 glycosylhydrolase [Bacteroidia bacterium]|nr:family 20 glycosylhydrolase [Bacteroidia bacterium]